MCIFMSLELLADCEWLHPLLYSSRTEDQNVKHCIAYAMRHRIRSPFILFQAENNEVNFQSYENNNNNLVGRILHII